MTHHRDNLYFERKKDGSVRILKLEPKEARITVKDSMTVNKTIMDVTISFSEWSSIIASMSKEGETAEKYQDAVKFHMFHSRHPLGVSTADKNIPSLTVSAGDDVQDEPDNGINIASDVPLTNQNPLKAQDGVDSE